MRAIQCLLAATTVATTLTLASQEAVRANGHESVIATGSFVGENGHVVSGEAKIIQRGEVLYLVLGEDFSFDGAPDPRLGFSSNNEFDGDSLFSGLNVDSGEQIYRLPATLDISGYDEVTIWCEKFAVPLAEAKF